MIKKIFRSLRVRIFVILFATGLISCLVMQYAILANYERRAVDLKTTEVQTQLRILANHLITDNFLQDPSSQVIISELNLLTNLYDGRVLVIGDNLQIIADTYNQRVGRTIISEDIVRCLRRGNEGAVSVYDPDAGYIEIATPIIETRSLREGESVSARSSGEDVVRGVMLTSVSTASIQTTLETLRNRAYRIEIIVILIIFFFALIAANGLLRPFDRITKAISEVKAGYSDEPISVPDYLETEHIVNAFNQLQSRMKVLDDSRSEFVSNVSHELKTPITSMKVLADTLLSQGDGVPVEVYRDFMTDISGEIDREDKIINDLLALVKLDKKTPSMNITNVNVNEMVEIILKRLRPIARTRNIELTLESKRDISAHIDEVKVSLALMNIMENAIKYNKDGGFVRVVLDADHQEFFVTVSDSGIGIPEESIEHIYERFYRVDKSRSREIGGTGLGLAVARTAVLQHRGTIEVESTEGEGTTFTVRLPLNYVAPETADKPERGRRRLFMPDLGEYRKIGKKGTALMTLFALAGSSVMLAGCTSAGGGVQSTDPDAFLLYHVNYDETGILSEPYTPASDPEDTEAMVEELLQVLANEEHRIAYRAPMTGDIRLLSHTLQEGVLTLNFDIRYHDMDPVTEILDRAAVVRTMTGIEGVETIIYQVDGTVLTDRSGTPIMSMNADTFIYNAGREINAFDKVRLTLYYTDETGKRLVPVYRTVIYNSNISIERLALEQLIMGPSTEGVYPTINPETKVTNITLRDRVCYVDLDEKFMTEPYGVTPEVAIYSLINTLAEMTEVSKVQISVNGDSSRRFMDQIPLSGQFERNLELLQTP